MDCQMCGKKDPQITVLLPLHQENGSLVTIACLECAAASDAYCDTHQWSHTGFPDGTTACALCVEEDVQKHKGRVAKVVGAVLADLPPAERRDVEEAAALASYITGKCEKVAALRFIVTKAHRLGCSVEDLATIIRETRSADSLLK